MCPSVNVSSLPAIPPAPPLPQCGGTSSMARVARELAGVRNRPQDAGRPAPMLSKTADVAQHAEAQRLGARQLANVNLTAQQQEEEKRAALCNALSTSGVESKHIHAAYDEITSDESPNMRRAGGAASVRFTELVANDYQRATGETLSVKSVEVQALAQRVMVLFNKGEIDGAQRDAVFNTLKKVGLHKPAAYVEAMVASVVTAIKTVTADDVSTAIRTGLVAVMKQQGIARLDEKSLTIGVDYFDRLLHKIDASLQGATREMAMRTALDALRYFMLPPASSGADKADPSSTSAPPAQPDIGAGPSDTPLTAYEEGDRPANAAGPSGTRSTLPRTAIPARGALPEQDEQADTADAEPAHAQPSTLKGMARRARVPVGRENPADVSASPEKNLQIHIHNNHSWSHNGVPMPPPSLGVPIASAPPAHAAQAIQRPVQTESSVHAAQPVQSVQVEPFIQRARTGQRTAFSALVKAGGATPPPAPSMLVAQPNTGMNEHASFQEKLAFFRGRETTALSPTRTLRTFKHAIVANDRYISATSGIRGREIQRHLQKTT